jgi:hypothetical protein
MTAAAQARVQQADCSLWGPPPGDESWVRTVMLPDGAGSVVVVVHDGRLRIAVFGDMPLAED